MFEIARHIEFNFRIVSILSKIKQKTLFIWLNGKKTNRLEAK